MAKKGRRDFLLQVRRPSAPDGGTRAENALLLRTIAAQQQDERPPASTTTNGDEQAYPGKIANFSKGLPHSSLGEVELSAYQSLLQALSSQKHSDAESILTGGTRKLVNPEAAFAYDIEGGDSHTFTAPPAPAFSSAQAATEMVELYWQALARDVPFAQYDTSPIIQNAAAELNGLASYQGPRDSSGNVTPDTLFRGTATGCLTGPYISQYLLQTIYIGSTPHAQTFRTGVVGTDYMAGYGEWLSVQSGNQPASTEVFDPQFEYLRNGRDLAQFSHYDFLVQAFLQAAIMLVNQYPETVLEYNLYQLNNNSPYKSSRIQTPFGTFCGPQVQDWLGRAAGIALKATWYNKWAVHRRLRPEEFGGRLYNTLAGQASYPVHPILLNSQALKLAIQTNGGALLPQAYVEGAPLHPSYPSAHAAVAAACATVVKAIYEGTSLISPTVMLSSDASSIVPYNDSALFIGDELNKLAFNLAMGRNWAGVNYRSDMMAGFAIGEEAGIGFLQGQVNALSETFAGFAFTRFDGTPVTITQDSGAYAGFKNLTPGQ